jgi:hypothetical protein
MLSLSSLSLSCCCSDGGFMPDISFMILEMGALCLTDLL